MTEFAIMAIFAVLSIPGTLILAGYIVAHIRSLWRR